MTESDKRKLEGAVSKALRSGLLRGIDAQYCQRMLTIGSKSWTVESTRKVWEYIKNAATKYDLFRYEIDFKSIPEPPIAPPPISRTKEDNHAVKITGRSIDFDDKKNFKVRFPFDRNLVDTIKQIPYQSRSFCKKTFVWTVIPRKGDWIDIAAVNALYQFGMMNGFEWSEEAAREIRIIREEVIRQVHKTEEAAKESEAIEADINIEGLGGVLRPFQRAGVAYALKHKRVFIADDMGLGKGHLPEELLPTINGGWIRVGDIKVGDNIIGRNGKSIQVTGVFHRGEQDLYRVNFWDGSNVVVDGDHLWSTWDFNLKRLVKAGKSMYVVRKTKDMYLMKKPKYGTRFRIPLCDPIDYQTKSFPIDPYTLGIIISEGYIGQKANSCVVSIANIDEDILNYIPYTSKTQRVGCYSAIIGGMLSKLNDMGLRVLSKEKHIPEIYFYGDVNQRKDILRGLMDGDGSVSKNRVIFCTSSTRLAFDVKRLIASLGGIGKIREYIRDGESEYQVNVKTGFCPFKCVRKSSLWKIPNDEHMPKRGICSIEKLDRKAETICISVDAKDKLYLVGNDYIVTHNTVQAIALAKAAEAFPLLVITKKALKANWSREIQKWIPGYYVTQDPKDMRFKMTRVCVINYDVIIKYEDELQNVDWKCIVLDESHACKEKKTKRTKAVIDLMKVAKPEYRLCLTGTPIKNRPKEYISQLVILDQQHIVGGEWEFLNKYCIDDEHTGFNGANRMAELNSILRKHCYIRRLKADVMKELPPKQHAVLELEIDNMREYLEAEQDIARYLIQNSTTDMDEEDKNVVREKAKQHEQLMKIGILKRISAHGKMAALKEWIEDLINSEQKLIIFAHHIEIQKAAAELFPLVTVSTRDSRGSQYAVDEFQRNPKCKIIVCSLERDKEGHTLTASSNVLFIEEPWTPADVDQASDRAHRIGQEDSVTVWYALARRTIDFDIHELIEEKRAVVTAATNGGEYVAQKSIVHDLINRIKKKIA